MDCSLWNPRRRFIDQLGEPLIDCIVLLLTAFEAIHLLPKQFCIRKTAYIPADMFAGGAHAGVFTIEPIVMVKMGQ